MAAPDRTDRPEPATDHDGGGGALTVVDVPDASRYELRLDGERVGLADYSIDGSVVTVPHVETDPAHRGRGYAATLMAGLLDDLRDRGRTIVPRCPFAASYVRDHPETQDLLAG
ncbi:GNAT family N-acetyltransferase [Ilumatobacter sp.]|uniref:GNAT family N-acetyltransferase n=1 Tax=Ilumatobacter sp. TaxID=1967498 RepID=UPI003B5203E7